MASNTIKEAMGLVNKRSVTDHVDGRRMREFNRTWRKEKFIVCTYVLVGTDLTTKLIANKPCFSSKVIDATILSRYLHARGLLQYRGDGNVRVTRQPRY